MKNNSFIPNLLILISILIGVSSCNSLKDNYSFNAQIPENYISQDSLFSRSDSTNIADISWQEYFQDQQLTQLIEKGLKHNFSIKNAIKNIETSTLKANQAKLNWLPSVDATIGNSAYQYRSENFYSSPSSNWYSQKNSDAPNVLYNYTNQNITGINLSWEIDIWGKIKDQKKVALNSYLESIEAKHAIQTQLISQIAEAYFQLILLNAQLEVAETNFELSKNTLNFVELQYQAGQITALAKQQTKAQMLTAQALIPSLKQQIALVENQLNFLIGDFPKNIDLSTKSLENYWITQALNEGIPLDIIDNRPDIRNARITLNSANLAVGIIQKQKYPSLKIDLSGGVNSMLVENWFNIPGSLFGSVVGSLTTPIFNKKRLKTNYKIALIEREKAEINFQKIVHQSILEITDALVILKTIDEQLLIAQEQVDNSKLAVKQSNLLFNSGFATYLEVINVQRSALENELNFNRLRKNKLSARIQLYKSLGGGWK